MAAEALIQIVLLLCLSAGLASTLRAKDRSASPAADYSNVADGRPWTMVMVDDGKKATLTLLPDGTGTMMDGGTMQLTPQWRDGPDGFCLKPSTFTRERCVELSAVPGGYDAFEIGKPAFAIRR